jgi:hypothetical protein
MIGYPVLTRFRTKVTAGGRFSRNLTLRPAVNGSVCASHPFFRSLKSLCAVSVRRLIQCLR